MSLTIQGNPPLAGPPRPLSVSYIADLQKALVAALAAVATQSSAASLLRRATFSASGGLIMVRTDASEAKLSLLLNEEALRIVRLVLQDQKAGLNTIRFLPQQPIQPKSGQAEQSQFEASFERLRKTAVNVNAVSDKLSKEIESLDAALKGLNLGVSAWVTLSESSDDDGTLYTDYLGYIRFGSRWGIALRSRICFTTGQDDDETVWLFSDAPRKLRIEAVEKLPALIEKLCVEAEVMLVELQSKVEGVSSLTATVSKGGSR